MVHGTCRWCRRTFWQFDALNELGVTEEDPEFLRASGRRFWMILEWLHHFASVFSVVLRNHHFLRLFFLKWMTVREWLLEPTNLRRPQHRKCEIFFEFWNSGGTKWWHSFFLKGVCDTSMENGMMLRCCSYYVHYFFCLNPTVMPCSGHSFCWNLGQTCRGYRIGPGILRKRCSARCPTLCSVAAATTVLLTMRLGWQISMWEVPTIDYPPGN